MFTDGIENERFKENGEIHVYYSPDLDQLIVGSDSFLRHIARMCKRYGKIKTFWIMYLEKY